MSEPTPSRAGRVSWAAVTLAVILLALAPSLAAAQSTPGVPPATPTTSDPTMAPSLVTAQSTTSTPPAGAPTTDPTMEPSLAAAIVASFVRSPDNVDHPARPRILDYFIPNW